MNDSCKRFYCMRPRGFSIVELIIVLAIAAIMATMATPSFRGLLRSFRITSATNDLLAAVNLTRSEAIARGRRVDLIPKDKDWARGWSVFIDKDGDQIIDADEPTIFTHGPLAAGVSISTTFSAADPPYVAYNATGHSRANSGSQVTRAGSWELSLDGQKRKIIINFLGRARTCNPSSDTDC